MSIVLASDVDVDPRPGAEDPYEDLPEGWETLDTDELYDPADALYRYAGRRTPFISFRRADDGEIIASVRPWALSACRGDLSDAAIRQADLSLALAHWLVSEQAEAIIARSIVDAATKLRETSKAQAATFIQESLGTDTSPAADLSRLRPALVATLWGLVPLDFFFLGATGGRVADRLEEYRALLGAVVLEHFALEVDTGLPCPFGGKPNDSWVGRRAVESLRGLEPFSLESEKPAAGSPLAKDVNRVGKLASTARNIVFSFRREADRMIRTYPEVSLLEATEELNSMFPRTSSGTIARGVALLTAVLMGLVPLPIATNDNSGGPRE